MPKLSFDSLNYARKLREAGVAEPEAEAHARAMSEAMGFFVTNLVTRSDLAETISGLELRLERRFSDVERRFSDVERRFSDVERRFSGIERQLAVHTALHGLTLAAVLLPQIRDWVA